ncbi:hypothetical protein ACE10X_23725 [Bradyrhizobium sp. Pha-3]|uniref:hypothetical protein n=1 Tax=Bradyrhizobium sp. Pha-3 TaxID=208375 RepID=UPI0035D50519
MTLTRDDLVVGVTIPGFFVLSVASMIACGHAFPAMHVWQSGITAQAVLGTAIMVAFVPAFVAARFSFGYLVGFSLLSAVFGFVWLSFFSAFDYPHAIARWAMIAALAAAMIPLMLQNIPVWRPDLSDAAVKRIAVLLLASCFAVLVADISYGANLGNPYGAARTAVVRPALMNYLTGIMIGAVLPYLFAHFASRSRWIPAAGVLLLALCFYPVVNNKTVLLLPIWLPFLFWLYGRFDPRLATVLAFLIPMVIGLFGLRHSRRRQELHRVQRHQSALRRNPVARARSIRRLLRAPRAHPVLPDHRRAIHDRLPVRRTRPDPRSDLSGRQFQRVLPRHRGHRVGRSCARPAVGACLRPDPVGGIDGLKAPVAALHRGFVRHRSSGDHERAAHDRPAVERHSAAVPAVVADARTAHGIIRQARAGRSTGRRRRPRGVVSCRDSRQVQ